ncbi:hypothetical protein [Rhodocaloribacter sp.]
MNMSAILTESGIPKEERWRLTSYEDVAAQDPDTTLDENYFGHTARPMHVVRLMHEPRIATFQLKFSESTLVAETWEEYLNIDARVLEVGDDWVRMDCLLDRESKYFEERVFERLLVEGAGPLHEGKYVLIRIRQRKGKQVVTFHDGGKCVRKDAFEDYSMFKDLLDEELQKPL